MFDLPDAKRVRRSDLYTRSGSQSPSPAPFEADPELEREIYARLAALYGPVSVNPLSTSTITDFSTSNPNPNPDQESNLKREAEPEPEAGQEQEQEFEFRLFSVPQDAISTSSTTQKIILTDDHPSRETGGFINPSRPMEYYISPPLTAELKARINASAIDGSTLLQWSKKRAWGLEVPWRVKVLRVSKSEGLKLKNGEREGRGIGGKDRDVVEEVDIELVDMDAKMGGEGKKKTKPNKKRRIILREKKKERQSIEEQRRKEKEAKEEAEREKRTRRNREKKVKRRMKEKAKKAEGGAVVQGVGMDIDGSGSE